MSYVDELRKKQKGASSLQSLIDETNSYYSQNQKQGLSIGLHTKMLKAYYLYLCKKKFLKCSYYSNERGQLAGIKPRN